MASVEDDETTKLSEIAAPEVESDCSDSDSETLDDDSDSDCDSEIDALSERAGLVFPGDRVHSLLCELDLADEINEEASVFLTATLEYLTREVLSTVGPQVRITPDNIFAVFRNSEDFTKLLGSNLMIVDIPRPQLGGRLSYGRFAHLVDSLIDLSLPAWIPVSERLRFGGIEREELGEALKCTHFNSRWTIVPMDFEYHPDARPFFAASIWIPDLPVSLRQLMGIDSGMILVSQSAENEVESVYFNPEDPNVPVKIVCGDNRGGYPMRVVCWEPLLVPPFLTDLLAEASNIPELESLVDIDRETECQLHDAFCDMDFRENSYIGGLAYITRLGRRDERATVRADHVVCHQCGGDTVSVFHFHDQFFSDSQFNSPRSCNLGFCPLCKVSTIKTSEGQFF